MDTERPSNMLYIVLLVCVMGIVAWLCAGGISGSRTDSRAGDVVTTEPIGRQLDGLEGEQQQAAIAVGKSEAAIATSRAVTADIAVRIDCLADEHYRTGGAITNCQRIIADCENILADNDRRIAASEEVLCTIQERSNAVTK